MENALKALVGTASIVVIVAGGYWGWTRFATHQNASAEADFASHRSACIAVLRDLNMGAYKVRPAADKCIADGYVTLDDEQDAEKRYIGGSSP